MWLMQALRWWLLIEAIGLLALPLAVKLLRFLPERGVTFRRPLGLLLGGALYWLLVTLGVLHNTTAGAASALLLMGGLSLAVGWRQRRLIWRELVRLRGYLTLEAAVFLLALVGWSLFRAYNPEISATEKPMEFAFLNGILRSPTFPPRDPWLAGYAISYYYLGYVLMAMLTMLSGLPSAVTFNLTGALLFALTVSGSLGLVYNLACASRAAQGEASPWRGGLQKAAALAGVLGATLAAVMGNLVGILELVRARGWGSEAFWRWLDVRGLGASAPSPTWYPQDNWWWWRASRVIHNRDLDGNVIEVISEFPFFSFLLGDNHPHVLALPCVLLALALALNVLLSRASRAVEGEDDALAGLGTPPALLRSGLGHAIAGLWLGGALEVLLWGALLGALGFLNTWDYPIYLGLFVAAYALLRYGEGARPWRWLSDAIQLGVTLAVIGILVYLPFYMGFRSQAGGIGLVPLYVKTPWQQFALMFGVQIVLLAGFLAAAARDLRGACPLPWPAALAGLAPATLAVAAALAGWGTAALCLLVLGASAALLLWGVVAWAGEGDQRPAPATLMALLMTTVGLALVASVEFVFLRDTFGTRMNTVFKFYYQGWILLSLSAAYGAHYVLRWARRAGWGGRAAAAAWAGLGALLILAGLAYPAAATVSKAGAFQGQPTLDGVRYVAEQRPDEYAAILWLQAHAGPEDIIAEAPGDSYSISNWISAHTGIPTLLGWGGHELQWRGSYAIPSQREPILDAIYRQRDLQATQQALQESGVDYVIVGPLERAYGADQATLDKLDRLMVRVFESDSIVIYAPSWP